MVNYEPAPSRRQSPKPIKERAPERASGGDSEMPGGDISARGSRLHSETPYRMMSRMAGMYRMNDLLSLVAREGAEELRLEPDRPPVMMLQGKPRTVDAMVVTSDNVAELFRSIATEEQRRELDQCGKAHFTYVGRDSGRFSIQVAMRGASCSLTIKNLDRQ